VTRSDDGAVPKNGPLASPLTPHPMSYNDAFDYVKGKRPLISPNLGFVLALHEQDKKNAKRIC